MYDSTGICEEFLWYTGTVKNGAYYYLYDGMGSVIGIVASDYTPVVYYDYDAWGKSYEITGTQAATLGKLNPFRYRGYCYDEEMGFYYVSSRYYDSGVGRFLNADSVIDNRGVITQNLFAYCGNNPINNADPTGHAFGWIVGAVVGGILGGLTAAASGKSVKAGIKSGALTGLAIGAICDMAIPGVVAGVLCAGVAAAGNIWNQKINYEREKEQYTKKHLNRGITVLDKELDNTSKSIPKKYQSFDNYVDSGSVVVAAVAAGVCAPIAVAGGNQVSNVFGDIAKSGMNTVSQFIAEWAIGTNVSVLQTSVEYIIPIFIQ